MGVVYVIIFCLSFVFPVIGYEFSGTHFMASYKGCNAQALQNVEELMANFIKAVKASGATVLGIEQVVFPGNGVTAVILLSESHASIHSYPEHNACFVDLFTCGSHTHYEPFHELFAFYLQATEVEFDVFERN